MQTTARATAPLYRSHFVPLPVGLFQKCCFCAAWPKIGAADKLVHWQALCDLANQHSTVLLTPSHAKGYRSTLACGWHVIACLEEHTYGLRLGSRFNISNVLVRRCSMYVCASCILLHCMLKEIFQLFDIANDLIYPSLIYPGCTSMFQYALHVCYIWDCGAWAFQEDDAKLIQKWRMLLEPWGLSNSGGIIIVMP